MCEIRFPVGEVKTTVSNSDIQLYRKKIQFVSQEVRHLTFIAWWCEIVHEVAEEIIKLHREVMQQMSCYFLSLPHSKHAEVSLDRLWSFLTFIWACSPEYSMDWKMCQVYLRLISVRATYWRYHRWIRTAALIAESRENRGQPIRKYLTAERTRAVMESNITERTLANF